MNLICENLYLGDQSAALSLDLLLHHGVTHVLNLTESVPNLFRPQLKYLQLKVIDDEAQNLESFFMPSIDFIEEGRQNGKVLVHCKAGVSRSAAIVLAYLIWKKSWTLSTAF